MRGLEQSNALSLIRPAWHYLHPEGTLAESELYQSSILSALLDGVYDGETLYSELEKHGDFGIGTVNALDGEMVAVDGVFYQLRSDGSARPVLPSQKTPFAVVTYFKPEKELLVAGPLGKSEFLKLIEGATEPNVFSAIRVDGRFDSVHTRTVAQQTRPYPRLVEAAQAQAVQSFSEVDGTLAGFRSPPFAHGIEVSGFHLHFLREDKLAGGHALDYTVRNVRVQVETLYRFHIELPRSAEFLEARLDSGSMDKDIKKAEG